MRSAVDDLPPIERAQSPRRISAGTGPGARRSISGHAFEHLGACRASLNLGSKGLMTKRRIAPLRLGGTRRLAIPGELAQHPFTGAHGAHMDYTTPGLSASTARFLFELKQDASWPKRRAQAQDGWEYLDEATTRKATDTKFDARSIGLALAQALRRGELVARWPARTGLAGTVEAFNPMLRYVGAELAAERSGGFGDIQTIGLTRSSGINAETLFQFEVGSQATAQVFRAFETITAAGYATAIQDCCAQAGSHGLLAAQVDISDTIKCHAGLGERSAGSGEYGECNQTFFHIVVGKMEVAFQRQSLDEILSPDSTCKRQRGLTEVEIQQAHIAHQVLLLRFVVAHFVAFGLGKCR